MKALASFGLPQEDIAQYVGVSHVTLRKHYSSELKLSAIKANATVGKYLFSLASGQAISKGATHGDCKTAAMFWAKTRMGWRETNHTLHGSDPENPMPSGVDVSATLASLFESINGRGKSINDKD